MVGGGEGVQVKVITSGVVGLTRGRGHGNVGNVGCPRPCCGDSLGKLRNGVWGDSPNPGRRKPTGRQLRIVVIVLALAGSREGGHVALVKVGCVPRHAGVVGRRQHRVPLEGGP